MTTKKKEVKLTDIELLKGYKTELDLAKEIMNAKNHADCLALANKLRDASSTIWAQGHNTGFQAGCKAGANGIKESLRELIGAAPEEHSHNIS